MARPSGNCNGVICYTDDDRAEIQAEKDVADAQAPVLLAEYQVKMNEMMAAGTAYTNNETLRQALAAEMQTAQQHACPA